jgi:hypothetical protein
MYTIYSFLFIFIILDNQPNLTVEDSQLLDDFTAELSSHHEFSLQPADLAKLLTIQKKRLTRKKSYS